MIIKSIRISQLSALLLLLCALPSYLWSQTAKLNDLEKRYSADGVSIVFVFKGAKPDYEVSTIQKDKIIITTITVENGTLDDEFSDIVARPIQHISFMMTNDEKPALKISLYLEEDFSFDHKLSENNIQADFSMSSLNKPEGGPIELDKISSKKKEDNSHSLQMEFGEMPTYKNIFLTSDLKQAIVVLHNTTASRSVLPKIKSDLIISGESLPGEDNNMPYQKFVFQSSQELLMDVADEENTTFAEFYGMGEQALASVTTEEKEEEYDYQGPAVKEKSNSWLYVSLGSVALIGGGIASYLLIMNQDDPQTSNVIPGIESEVTLPTRPPE
ncbi:MAG: hypothetical protein HQK83_05000 [Fibrobacteria bacterium]|nr:hypothetical protein [Fibrobacteria bacterium]